MGDDPVYKVEKIFAGAWAIDEGNVRCFLITGEKRALLLDTGYGGGDLFSLVAGLTNLPVKVALTHTDGDHTGALAQFSTAYMHPAEYENFYSKREGMEKPEILPLWEGNAIDLGGTEYEVVLIPGHTPGSIALYERDRNIMFTGDSVASVPIFMFGRGRDIRAYICSMEKLARTVKEATRLLASHGERELSPSLLPRLIKGAKDVIAGSIKGVKPDRDLPCLLYECGEVMFYY